MSFTKTKLVVALGEKLCTVFLKTVLPTELLTTLKQFYIFFMNCLKLMNSNLLPVD